jgi:hypothetical protein
VRHVLAIAKAQYQPRGTESGKTTDPVLAHLASSDKSDSDEEDHSDYGEQEPINFTDITSRPSFVRTHVSPGAMLEVQAHHLQAGHKCLSCTPLQKAIVENDFEAFVHTLDLYDFVAMKISRDTFNLAVTLDRPEMVNELICHSGLGIPIPSDAEKGRKVGLKVSEKHIYVGLKVGGKRCLDIEIFMPKCKTLTYNYEFLRNAISSGVTKVIDYLAGPRPIAAFRHYAETHDDEIAQYLKCYGQLAVVSDLDDGGVCPECRQRAERSAVL